MGRRKRAGWLIAVAAAVTIASAASAAAIAGPVVAGPRPQSGPAQCGTSSTPQCPVAWVVRLNPGDPPIIVDGNPPIIDE